MVWPFKRKESCRHYKGCGEPVPNNMIQLVRFSPYETDSIGYGISECNICAKRAFACMGGIHSMSNCMAGIIDEFIAYKIELNVFKEILNKEMAWNEWKAQPQQKD